MEFNLFCRENGNERPLLRPPILRHPFRVYIYLIINETFIALSLNKFPRLSTRLIIIFHNLFIRGHRKCTIVVVVEIFTLFVGRLHVRKLAAVSHSARFSARSCSFYRISLTKFAYGRLKKFSPGVFTYVICYLPADSIRLMFVLLALFRVSEPAGFSIRCQLLCRNVVQIGCIWNVVNARQFHNSKALVLSRM